MAKEESGQCNQLLGVQRREVREGLGKEATGDRSEYRLSGVEGLSLSEVG